MSADSSKTPIIVLLVLLAIPAVLIAVLAICQGRRG